MGRETSKISDQGQWLNNGKTLAAFYDEMDRNGNRIDNLNYQLRNANDQLNDQNEELGQLRTTTNEQNGQLENAKNQINAQNTELVKLRAEKKDLWSKVYGQNSNVSDGRARIRELTESEKTLKQENARLRLRLKQINELSAP